MSDGDDERIRLYAVLAKDDPDALRRQVADMARRWPRTPKRTAKRKSTRRSAPLTPHFRAKGEIGWEIH